MGRELLKWEGGSWDGDQANITHIGFTPLKTNMTLEYPQFQKEIHLPMVSFLLTC